MEPLAPFRARIDEIDAEILRRLAERFEIVRQVAEVKRREGIAPVLPGRIDEVKSRAAEAGERLGLAPRLVRALYTLIIDEACRLEERLIGEMESRSAD